jgi:Xaa-Pro aminopeptidase
MRSDLDRLMRERSLAGMVVFAYDRYSPAMHYATGQKLHYGIYFRAPGAAAAGDAGPRAHLIHDPMERDQAAAVGCEHSGFPQHGFARIQTEEGGHPARAFGRLIGESCATLGIRGRIALFGELPGGFAYGMAQRMLEVNPALSVDSGHPDLMLQARSTKDPDEVEAIRRVSRGTVAAMRRVRDFLASLRREGEGFRGDGQGPVRLGDLRRVIHREFLEHGLAEDQGDSIVSQGRDAGVPHNRGEDDEPLAAGRPVIVDIFPGESGGGYHSDMTRTFCMGAAPAAVREIYAQTQEAFAAAMGALAPGRPLRSFQDAACEVYEKHGHATRRTNDATQEGYVHNLGHGVGLSVHDPPLLGGPPTNTAVLEPGMVVTVEPGLYYPERGMGCRIEDLLYVRPDGTIENLTPFPYDFEIEPRG